MKQDANNTTPNTNRLKPIRKYAAPAAAAKALMMPDFNLLSQYQQAARSDIQTRLTQQKSRV